MKVFENATCIVWTRLKDGSEGEIGVTYEVELDIKRVKRMIANAANSKGQKCVRGPVKVTIKERRGE